MRALTSPIRMQIISIMEKHGDRSVREIASHLGMLPESVYNHVHELVKLGLLVESGRRSGTTRSEALFRLIADRVHVDWASASPTYRTALKKATRVAHRLSERVMEEAIDDADCPINRPGARARFQQESVILDEKHLRELLVRLEELDSFLAEKHDPEAEDVYVVTVAVGPLRRGR